MRSFSRHTSLKVIASAFSGWDLSWEGLIDNKKGEWWLLGQIVLIAAHLIPRKPISIIYQSAWPQTFIFIGTCLFFIGVVLAGKAFLSLGASLSPLPQPKQGASLITQGSYKHCRHPLYQALLICSSGILIAIGSLLHFILFLSLSALLKSKAKKEEEQLKIKHSSYTNYVKDTPAIFPNIPFLDWRI